MANSNTKTSAKTATKGKTKTTNTSKPKTTMNSAKSCDCNCKSGLSWAIVFASVVVSASLVFFGISLSGNGKGLSEEDFREQLDKNLLISLDKLESKDLLDVLDKAVKEVMGEEAPQPEAEFIPENLDMVELADDDPVMGDPDAPITIVEFSDYQCYYCQSFYNNTLPTLKEEYIDTGKVKLVYRDLPLESIHPGAYDAAMAAECVQEQSDDETYFLAHNYLFENIGTGDLDFESFANFVESNLGLNRGALTTCFENRDFEDEVYEDTVVASDLGITGTPSFVVNGEIIKGAVPIETLEAVFDQYL